MQKYKLSNGITVVEDKVADSQSFTLMVMFRTGSRNETPEIWGISHFLEHMAFKGTKSYPNASILAKELDSLGAMYNAFTGKEYTGYYIKGSKKVFDRTLKIMSEMTTAPIILDEEVDRERGTIIEEINMNEDDPKRKIYDVFENSIYDNRQISQDIIGSIDSVSKITAKDIIKYREKYYKAGNAIISIAGYIPDKASELFEKAFELMEKGETSFLPSIHEDNKRIYLEYKDTQQTHLAIGFPGVQFDSNERDAAQLLGVLLGGPMSSRMFSEVREKRGLAYYVNTYSDNMADTGSFVTFSGVNNEKTLEAVEIIVDVYKSVLRDIPEEELRRNKDYVIGIITLRDEDSENRSHSNALSTNYGQDARTLEERITAIEKITTEDLLKLARKIIDMNKVCLALIGPFKDESKFAKILEK
jgi:predicted Zn-dependent peptidase